MGYEELRFDLLGIERNVPPNCGTALSAHPSFSSKIQLADHATFVKRYGDFTVGIQPTSEHIGLKAICPPLLKGREMLRVVRHIKLTGIPYSPARNVIAQANSVAVDFSENGEITVCSKFD